MIHKLNNKIPNTYDELVKLPGIGDKSAKVFLLKTSYKDVFPVDTHVKRLSGRLGLSIHDNPVKIERDLIRRIPQDHWIRLSHQLIHHGRQICKARKPRCERCTFADLCPYFQEFSE